MYVEIIGTVSGTLKKQLVWILEFKETSRNNLFESAGGNNGD